MRVLHLDGGREMRGGQWQVLRLIEGLAARGIESILLARPGGPLFRSIEEPGWRVEPWSVMNASTLARKCDLLHAHDARSHTLGAFLCGMPLVVARRVAFPVHSRWKYRRASRYIAVSEFVQSVLVTGGVPADKIAVVYDGVPLLEHASGSAVMAPANAADPAKGAALLMEAAALAKVQIEFTADLERDLHRAALFVYISHSEGLGSGALLAMSAGVPVIASNIGGLRELIRHGENGLLVENGAEPIAAALREMLAKPSFARQLGAAGRRTVEQQFTTDLMVDRTIEVYRQVLA